MTFAKRSADTARAALVSLALAIAGCGTPGPPQPPSLNLPDRVENLAAVRTGNQVKLTWTMPKRNTDRIPLKSDVVVKVCRLEAANQCTQAATLNFAPGADGAFTDSLPALLATGAPRLLSYSVELENRNGRSAGTSNIAVVLAGEAPAPVGGFAAEERKSGIVLRWTAVDPHDAVRIHRNLLTPHSAPAVAGPLAPPAEPIDQDLLVDSDTGVALDKSIAFGQTYEYRAQRIARIEVGGSSVELAGDVSAPIRIDAQDVFPPAVPSGLAAVATAGAPGAPTSIDLNWEPETEQDLAGYFVYRREDETPWKRISGEQPLVGPGFHDTDVLSGRTYRYGVSAIDRGGHESGRSAEARETAPNP
jgi:hypothetical protein